MQFDGSFDDLDPCLQWAPTVPITTARRKAAGEAYSNRDNVAYGPAYGFAQHVSRAEDKGYQDDREGQQSPGPRIDANIDLAWRPTAHDVAGQRVSRAATVGYQNGLKAQRSPGTTVGASTDSVWRASAHNVARQCVSRAATMRHPKDREAQQAPELSIDENIDLAWPHTAHDVAGQYVSGEATRGYRGGLEGQQSSHSTIDSRTEFAWGDSAPDVGKHVSDEATVGFRGGLESQQSPRTAIDERAEFPWRASVPNVAGQHVSRAATVGFRDGLEAQQCTGATIGERAELVWRVSAHDITGQHVTRAATTGYQDDRGAQQSPGSTIDPNTDFSWRALAPDVIGPDVSREGTTGYRDGLETQQSPVTTVDAGTGFVRKASTPDTAGLCNSRRGGLGYKNTTTNSGIHDSQRLHAGRQGVTADGGRPNRRIRKSGVWLGGIKMGGLSGVRGHSCLPGPWNCPNCHNHNWSFRHICNRCPTLRPGEVIDDPRAMEHETTTASGSERDGDQVVADKARLDDAVAGSNKRPRSAFARTMEATGEEPRDHDRCIVHVAPRAWRSSQTRGTRASQVGPVTNNDTPIVDLGDTASRRTGGSLSAGTGTNGGDASGIAARPVVGEINASQVAAGSGGPSRGEGLGPRLEEHRGKRALELTSGWRDSAALWLGQALEGAAASLEKWLGRGFGMVSSPVKVFF